MEDFNNILVESRKSCNDLVWAIRTITFTKSYTQDRPKLSPDELKATIYNDEKLYIYLQKICEANKITLSKKAIVDVLNEIGYAYDLSVIRLLGYLLIKFLRKSYSALYINEQRLFNMKNGMGHAPIIFMPTHRSYCDFILMAFICFNYGIHIPCVAAGMDFHSMRFMNEILRKCKAFYMRRTFSDDIIYRTIFKNYIKALISYEDSPVEFFIEGTRSRSGKSIMPKFGLLSMLIEAYICGDIPDISVIPVNISYDRILEEKLFAYEHLGIPKPKESTKGLIKALINLQGSYGRTYVNFGEPFSIRDYLIVEDHLDRSGDFEASKIKDIAFKIIKAQQNLQVYGPFNLLALIIFNTIRISGKFSLCFQDAVDNYKWLLNLYHKFDARVCFEGTIEDVLKDTINIHSSLVKLSKDGCINFQINQHLTHSKDEMYSAGLPFVMLQLYINPSLNIFIRSSMIVAILMKISEENKLSEESLYENYRYLCGILRCEFILNDCGKEQFIECISKLNNLDIITRHNELIELQQGTESVNFLYNLIQPFLVGIYLINSFLFEFQSEIKNKNSSQFVKMAQSYVGSKIKSDIDYYCLSADLIMNTFKSLIHLNVIKAQKEGILIINEESLRRIIQYLGKFQANEEPILKKSALIGKSIQSKL